VVDFPVRGLSALTERAGVLLRRSQTGLATAYLAWLMLAAVLIGLAGVVLS
jgi:hypothetical protein